jgi:hypothetical protein
MVEGNTVDVGFNADDDALPRRVFQSDHNVFWTQLFLHDLKCSSSRDLTQHFTGKVPRLYLDDLHFLDGDLVVLARSVLHDKCRAARDL